MRKIEGNGAAGGLFATLATAFAADQHTKKSGAREKRFALARNPVVDEESLKFLNPTFRTEYGVPNGRAGQRVQDPCRIISNFA